MRETFLFEMLTTTFDYHQLKLTKIFKMDKNLTTINFRHKLILVESEHQVIQYLFFKMSFLLKCLLSQCESLSHCTIYSLPNNKV